MIGFWTHAGWLWGLLGVPVYFVLLLFSLAFRSQSIPDLRIWREIRDAGPREHARAPSAVYWLSALLLSLLLVGVLAALAGPVSRSPSAVTPLLHVVLDRSARMNAVEPDGRTRYQHALDRLRSYAERMPDNARWRATLTGRSPRTINGSPADVLERLSRRRPTDLSFRRSIRDSLDEVLRSPSAHTILITDRQTELPRSTAGPAVSVLPVGSPRPNTGLLSLYGFLRDQRLTLFVRLGHFGPNERRVSVSVSKPEQPPLASKRVTLSPDAPISITLEVAEWDRSSLGHVRIDVPDPDALNADNRAYFVSTHPFRTRVHPHGPENDHLFGLIDAMPAVVRSSARDADVNLFYRPDASTTEQLWRRGGGRPAVVIAPDRPSDLNDPFTSAENVRFAPVRGHAITADLPVDTVHFRRTTLLKPGGASEITPLFEGAAGVLSFLKNGPPETLWFLGDPFLASGSRTPPTNWAIHPDRAPSFVMFWQNVFAHFRPWSLQRRGDLVYWTTGSAPLRDARFENGTAAPVDTSRVRGADVTRFGRTVPVPINLLDANESDTYNTLPKRNSSPPLPDPETLMNKTRHTRTVTLTLLAALFLILPGLRYLHGK